MNLLNLARVIFAAAAGALVTACSTGAGGMNAVLPPGLDTSSKWTTYLRGEPTFYEFDKLVEAIGPRATVRGKVIDLNGGKISGDKLKKPKDRNDEDAVALRIRIAGVTIKNGIIDRIPGGIVVGRDDCTFENLIFRNIGEDALSNNTDKSANMRVIGCTFLNDSGGDKSAQWNDGRDGLARNNYFTGGITGIRVQESTGKAKNVKFRSEGNVFRNVPTAHNVDGDTVVTARGNEYHNVQKRWVIRPRARVDEK